MKGQLWAPGSRGRAGERGQLRYCPVLAGTSLRRGAQHCLGRDLARSRAEPGEEEEEEEEGWGHLPRGLGQKANCGPCITLAPCTAQRPGGTGLSVR